MAPTRFKILAGTFGVAVCGLVALGQPPACIPPIPSPAPVIVVQATAPSLPVPTSPVPPLEKQDSGSPAIIHTPGINVRTTAPAPTNTLPTPSPLVEVPQPSTPTLPPPITTPPATHTPPMPIAPIASQPTLTLPVPTESATPQYGYSPPPVKMATGHLENVGTGKTGLQVHLKLGDGPPKFEVCRGDDVLLKVVCTGIDVKAPSEKGEPFSVLRASGSVQFSAPGCEGTCEALVVHPGTGEVILTKSVEVKCKLGKGTTVMKAEQILFKLGTAPAFAVNDVGSLILPTAAQK